MAEVENKDVPEAPDSHSQERLLQSLLAKKMLSDEEQHIVTESLGGGIEGNREALNTILASASDSLLDQSLGNDKVRTEMWHQSGADTPIVGYHKATVLHLLAPRQRDWMLERQLCYELFDGVRGTDLRTTLQSTVHYIEEFYTLPREERETGRRFISQPEKALLSGMLSPELHRELKAFQNLLKVLQSGVSHEILAAVTALNIQPISPAIAELLSKPETLYERLLLEEQIAVRQTVEYNAWWEAADGRNIEEVAAFIHNDPTTFIHSLIAERHNLVPNSLDTTWDAATPATRDCMPIGRPEFDLPIALLQKLNPQTRSALRAVLDLETSDDATTQTYIESLREGFALYEESLDGKGAYTLEITKDALSDIAGRLEAGAGKKHETKFTRLWKEVFPARRGQPLARTLIRTIGFIPEGLYQLKNVAPKDSREKSDVTFTDIAMLHLLLVQEYEDATRTKPVPFESRQQKRVLHARWQLLEQFFISGIAGRTLTTPDARRRATRLDARGIRIDIEPPRQSDQTGQLHAHIPYIMATDAVLNKLVAEEWISGAEREEVQLQRAVRQQDTETQKRLEASKVEAFTAAAESNGADLSQIFTDNNHREAAIVVIQRQRRFPASFTEKYLSDAGEAPDLLQRVVHALWIMQDAQAGLFRKYNRQQDVLQDSSHAAVLSGVLFPVLTVLSEQKASVQELLPVQWRRIAKTDESETGYLSIGTGKTGATILVDLHHLPAGYASIVRTLCAI